MTRDPACAMCASLEIATPLYADELWHVRPIDPPWAIAGWMLVISQRHCAGIAELDDTEARCFGPALRHFERTLLEVTGAMRIYTAALGESQRHLHCHMVPRYANMPAEASGWAVFDLERAAAAGDVPLVDSDQAAAVHDAYRRALELAPPPRM